MHITTVTYFMPAVEKLFLTVSVVWKRTGVKFTSLSVQKKYIGG